LGSALGVKNPLASAGNADTLISAPLDGGLRVQKGRHNLEHIVEHGCLTQRSQLERLQEVADLVARERVKTLAADEYLPSLLFVIDREGKDSVWELDRMDLARSTAGRQSNPQLSFDNLVTTQAMIGIVRDADASAIAVVAAASMTLAALQLADLDHEQTLTSRIERANEAVPTLAKWDFGNVAWTVRLRQVLQAAAAHQREDGKEDAPARPMAVPVGVRPAEQTPNRRNHRREMREQLHGTPAAAPSWLQ
jgi:hypothetical protein